MKAFVQLIFERDAKKDESMEEAGLDDIGTGAFYACSIVSNIDKEYGDIYHDIFELESAILQVSVFLLLSIDFWVPSGELVTRCS